MVNKIQTDECEDKTPIIHCVAWQKGNQRRSTKRDIKITSKNSDVCFKRLAAL